MTPQGGRRGFDPLRLTETERRWAEGLFAAILGAGEGGSPSFDEIDRTTFWEIFESAPSPLVRAGLRPMLHTLTFLPLAMGFGAPFFRLDAVERGRFLETAARDRRYFVRQSVSTLKMLACFAYFEDERVRARHQGRPA